MDAEARRAGQGRAAAKRTLDAPKRFGRINRRSDVRSPSIKLLQQAPHIRNVQKLAGTRHVHRLILFPIEVPGCRVHGGNEFRIRCKRAFQEPVVWFVPDDTELGQRIAHREVVNNFSDKFRVVAEDVGVLFEDGRADPRLDQTGARELVDECRGVIVGWVGRSRASECRCQGRLARYGLARRSARARRLVSTNATASVSVMALPRFWRCARASAGDSLNRTTLPPTTAVAYMTSAYAKAAADTSDPGCTPAGMWLIRPDETTQPRVQFLAARRPAIRHVAALTSRSELDTRNRDVNDPVGRARGRTRAPGPGSFTSWFRSCADTDDDRGGTKAPPRSTRGPRAQVVAPSARCRPLTEPRPYISTERSCDGQGVEGPG